LAIVELITTSLPAWNKKLYLARLDAVMLAPLFA